MKRRVRILVVLASVLALMTVNVGAALAVDDGPSPAFGTEVGDAPSPIPVGSHLLGDPAPPGNPGAVNGFGNTNSSAGDAIAHNPNCPAHYAP